MNERATINQLTELLNHIRLFLHLFFIPFSIQPRNDPQVSPG